MLLKAGTLQAIRDGSVTLQFRRWRRPTVKAGGTLLTAVGELAIEAVDRVEPGSITAAEALQAGFPDRDALLARLEGRTGNLYRIRLSWLREDPRSALRESLPGDDELDALVRKLSHLDSRSRRDPWTRETLRALRDHPGVRAAELAEAAGMETRPFKADVRKLKTLGLTESLEVGYRLSPRGAAVLARLEEERGP